MSSAVASVRVVTLDPGETQGFPPTPGRPPSLRFDRPAPPADAAVGRADDHHELAGLRRPADRSGRHRPRDRSGSRAGGHRTAPEPDAAPPLSAARTHQLGLDAGPTRGPATAPVTIAVFTDAMCKWCGSVLRTIDQLWNEYPGKLKLVVKQSPCTRPRSSPPRVAGGRGASKFWELHDAMMAHQDDLSRDALISYAHDFGLDVPSFDPTLDRHALPPPSRPTRRRGDQRRRHAVVPDQWLAVRPRAPDRGLPRDDHAALAD